MADKSSLVISKSRGQQVIFGIGIVALGVAILLFVASVVIKGTPEETDQMTTVYPAMILATICVIGGVLALLYFQDVVIVKADGTAVIRHRLMNFVFRSTKHDLASYTCIALVSKVARTSSGSALSRYFVALRYESIQDQERTARLIEAPNQDKGIEIAQDISRHTGIPICESSLRYIAEEHI